MGSLRNDQLFKLGFREPKQFPEPIVAKIEIPENCTLICLFSRNSKTGAALVVNSSWETEDKTALKDLIKGFTERNGIISPTNISAKIVGPKHCVSLVETLFSSHGIRVLTSHELDREQETDAFFYSDSGRLRLEKLIS